MTFFGKNVTIILCLQGYCIVIDKDCYPPYSRRMLKFRFVCYQLFLKLGSAFNF